jgi:hypothetical protein
MGFDASFIVHPKTCKFFISPDLMALDGISNVT